ncbi:Pyruvate decarboxylase 1 [Ascosphaera pollenicola]|nr:Pyruvate decarboxylase 1 [Ascosphaera pollenicola]
MAPTLRRYKAISPADSSAQALPLPPDQLLEEERQPTYDAEKFFPAKLYQVLRKRYQLVAKLGYGATSTVWLAMDLKAHHHVFSSPPPKYVAVKILRQTFTTPYTAEPEKHELEMVNTIKAVRSKHPGREFVSTVRKSFETSSPFGGMHTCLVSDVMCEPLSTLQQRFEGGVVPLRYLKLICQDVLQGLQFLHQDCHLVHTDIKPDNIMLSLTDVSILDRIVREELETPLPRKMLWDRTIYLSRSGHGAALNVLGRAKITDFGLAVRGDGELLTHAIHPNGYRAPEVVLGAALEKAKNPVILVDACAVRFRCLEEVNDLVKKSGFPTFVAPMGKGAVDETLPNFGGVYAGEGSQEGVKEQLESSDLVLSIGGIKSDFNTCGFTYRTTQMNTIDFHSDHCTVRYSDYPRVGMKGVIRRIVERMGDLNVKWESKLANVIPKDKKTSMSPTITHHWMWPAIGQWLRNNDIIITETGTANFGIWETRFPRGASNISQVLWGSIGYSVGACQGAVLAARDLVEAGDIARRTILFVGDGSLQLTVQEISTMIRRKLCPIIFIICNNGYTIERYIHGWESEYNDIQPWRHLDLAKQFGAKEGTFRTYSVKTKTELLNLCKDEQFSSADVLQLVEIHMPQDDCPRSLKLTCIAAANMNKRVTE